MERLKLEVLGPYNVGKETVNEPIPAKPEHAVRFVCVSDTHSRTDLDSFPLIPDGDVLIHCGDFTQSSLQAEYEKFFKFLDSLPHKHKIVIAGNHDVALDVGHYQKSFSKILGHKSPIDSNSIISELKSHCIYLLEEELVIEGIKLFGTPYTSGNSADWGFGYSEPKGTKHWNKIPRDVDILVSHSPPYGILDESLDNSHGCQCLLNQVTNGIKPSVHVFGHVHEGYGILKKDSILFINAASVNKFRKPTNKPVVFDIIK